MASLALLAMLLPSLFLIGCLAQDVDGSLTWSLSGTEVKTTSEFGSVIWQPALKKSPVALLGFRFYFFPFNFF